MMEEIKPNARADRESSGDAEIFVHAPENSGDALPNGPLVTFALFAYNQENFIREAIEGAFSQTYRPLEIIVSDDHSSDRTAEIMQDLVAAYRGPHKIVVRKGRKNLGLAGHINAVSRIATGEIVVMAAGDDISFQHRTARIIQEFSSHPGTTSVFSGFEPIPKNANVDGGQFAPVLSATEMLILGGGVQKGATYAYSRECFQWPEDLPAWVISEDRVLPLRASLIGYVRYIDEPLIRYRLASTEKLIVGKNSRPLWLHVEQHFPVMISHVQHWLERNPGHWAKFYFYVFVVKYLQYVVGRNKRIGKPALSGPLFAPLRVLRKMVSTVNRIYS